MPAHAPSKDRTRALAADRRRHGTQAGERGSTQGGPPNPIGLHEVTIVAIEGARMRVSALETLDGTPVVDVNPVLR
jgi:tRNA (Thr-GGU) A37 N-methylase